MESGGRGTRGMERGAAQLGKHGPKKLERKVCGRTPPLGGKGGTHRTKSTERLN